jgi:hypothetical protein
VIAAHPFGDPQTLTVTRDDDDPAVVHLTWKVGAADDLTLLGIHLGVLPEDRLMLDGAVAYDAGDAALVQQAPELASYLRAHLAVTASGTACVPRVGEAGDLVADGVDVAFTCPTAPASVAVTATTLTDLHPAYRALATGPGGQHQVYGSDAPTHEWALGVTAPGARPTGAGSSAALQIGGVLGAVLSAVVVGAVVARRRRRREVPSPLTP